MKSELAAAALAALLALALPASGPTRACDNSSDANKNGKYVKPSSLSPGERAYRNQYGAPIPKPIFARRPSHKPKSQPQLRSSPLPAA